MRIAAPVLAALATLAPSIALACPYAAKAAGDCASCGSSSVFGYGAAALLGLGIGVASVAFERRKS